AAHPHVAHYAHDRERAPAPLDHAAHRVSVRPVLPRHALVDHRRPWRVGQVRGSERPATEQRNAHHAEIVVAHERVGGPVVFVGITTVHGESDLPLVCHRQVRRESDRLHSRQRAQPLEDRLLRRTPLGIARIAVIAERGTRHDDANTPRALRSRCRACPPPTSRRPDLSVSPASLPAERSAGTTPHTRAVTNASTAVNASTSPSTRACASPAMLSGPTRRITATMAIANAMPTAPPAAASSSASISACPITWPAPAPNARRSAISGRRDTARASSRCAAFAQAMSSTTTTAPARARSNGRASARASETRPSTVACVCTLPV